MTYEEYLASYHGPIAPQSKESWENTTLTNLRCASCGASFSAKNSEIEMLRGIAIVRSPCHRTIEFINDTPEEHHVGGNETNPKDILGEKKVPLHLIPSSPLAHLAMVMKLGAEKYGPYNWREKEIRATIYIDAALRHLRAMLDGQDMDEESGRPHAVHVMACMAIYQDAVDIGRFVDDRPAPGNFPQIIKELEL